MGHDDADQLRTFKTNERISIWEATTQRDFDATRKGEVRVRGGGVQVVDQTFEEQEGEEESEPERVDAAPNLGAGGFPRFGSSRTGMICRRTRDGNSSIEEGERRVQRREEQPRRTAHRAC